ncbi:Pvc16 family protein [Sphingobacterium paucimobilis]|uniref:Pvc16 N-terminal domain-containing protein n=1 Tax=Sphingobacterium paucimobilis HER1398 TaxID=1346330 RepID=U2HDM4_9SPHI|nr:Pvc16 family protein [Sphingobacterium paucimobilis]ERJ59866.1 hypothetical protein M472_13930 [Sphingobacterium paucimobilis HER1398]
MIYNILTKLKLILNEGVKSSFGLVKDIVEISSITKEKKEGRVLITLLNVERDTSAGINFKSRAGLSVSNKFIQGNPSWSINLLVLVSVVFPSSGYESSLKIMDLVLDILQRNHQLNLPNSTEYLVIEPVNVSISELSNIWSICSSDLNPSIVLRIRSFNIDGNGVMQIHQEIKERILDLC